MSNLISNSILNSFEIIQKITTFLESEEKRINSKWSRKIILWPANVLSVLFICVVIFFSHGRRHHNHPSWAESLGYEISDSTFSIIVTITIIAGIGAFILYWLYTGKIPLKRHSVFSVFAEKRTVNPILEALITGLYDSFTSASKVISESEAYLVDLLDFLKIHHKEFGKVDELKDKIRDNFYVVLLCVNLLIFLRKNLKIGSEAIPNFENLMFKTNVLSLEKSIDQYAAKVPQDLGEKCLRLKNLKKDFPLRVQHQVEQFISEKGNTGHPHKTLALLDFLEAQALSNPECQR